MKSVEELSQTSKDTSIQKLREEFNKKSFHSENHPKTSHEYKRAIMNSTNLNKKYTRTNKALSASKFNHNIWNNNLNKLNDKDFLDFYRKHPGYLYYKEIISNMKIKQTNKKRAFTGKEYNPLNKKYLYKKAILYNTNYNHYNNNTKFPKINKNNNINNYFNGQKKHKYRKTATNPQIKNLYYNFNYNNYNFNHNHNYNINNININFKDKKNPYSLSWVNKILNQNDYKLEIKEKSKKQGMPKIVLNNVTNTTNTKLFINNFVEKKDKKENKEINNDNNKEKKENNNDNIDNDNDDLDDEQQMQFYKNQKNFFKARKDIKEEPEDLEEDKDDDNNKK